MSVNKVILVGNVGKDPEVKYLDADVPVAKFPFATSESYKAKNGEKVETTEWHNIVVWRGLAKVVESYVKKGSKLYLEGKINTRQYEKDGQNMYFTDIVVNNLVMLDSKPSSAPPNESKESTYQSAQSNSPAAEAPDVEEPGEEDDLPF